MAEDHLRDGERHLVGLTPAAWEVETFTGKHGALQDAGEGGRRVWGLTAVGAHTRRARGPCADGLQHIPAG